MPEPHKRANRHPKYKTAYRIHNWSAYDKALRDRGDFTLWLSQDAITAWTSPKTGKETVKYRGEPLRRGSGRATLLAWTGAAR